MMKPIKEFLEALQHNPALDWGFEVSDTANKKCCYCPCGSTMWTWRQIFELGDMNDSHYHSGDNCQSTESFTPDALMEHLRSHSPSGPDGGMNLHSMTHFYLTQKYELEEHNE